MIVGVIMVVVGAAVYLGTPAIAFSRPDPNPAPGGDDVAPWVTITSLLGGLITLAGILVVVLSLFGFI